MTPATYKAHLKRLGLHQEAAAELMGYAPRSGQYWAAQGPPMAVAMLVAVAPNRAWLEWARGEAAGTIVTNANAPAR